MMSAEDGAQTMLHDLLDDDVAGHTGASYNQDSIRYPDKRNRGGGRPMDSPNPQACDEALVRRLYEASTRLVVIAEGPGGVMDRVGPAGEFKLGL